MRFLKYLFLLLIFISFDLHAYCAHPAYSYGTTRLNPMPSTACYPEVNGHGFCKFKVEQDSPYMDSPNPNLAPYAVFTLSSISSRVYRNSDCTVILQEGCTQSSDGSIQCEEEEEEEEEEENDPILQCSTDSCPNPENKRCPVGYTRGSLNGQSICVKSKTQNPEDPTECTGEDCGIRTDRIVTAVNNANNDITTSIDNLSTVFDAPFETLKQYLSDISDKLSLMTDKIGNSGNPPVETPQDQDDVDTSQLDADVPFQQTEKQQISSNIFSSKSQCPQSRVLSLPKYGISYEFSFDQICNFLNLLSYFVMIIAYVIAAYIVVKA